MPPGMGIVHQINLEYLAQVVQVRDIDGVRTALPDTLVGTDSHTPMVNGVGVLGWGVGGIEAEACMLGQPLFLLAPVVVGVRFHNALPAGTTATDLVLTLTELLRKHGVVNKFVEFCGSGLELDVGPRPGDALQHVAGVRRHRVTVPRRRANARVPPRLRPRRRTTSTSSSATRRNRACSAPTTRRSRPSARWSSSTSRAWCRASPGPKRPQDRVALPRVWESFCNVWAQPPTGRRTESPAEGEISREEEEGGIDPDGMVEEPTPNGLRGLRPGPGWVGRDRRHHLVHQHLQPGGDGCRGPARAQRRRARSHASRLRQDIARARARAWSPTTSSAQGCSDSLEQLRFNLVGLRLHHLYRQQRPAAGAGRGTHRRRRTSPSLRCSAATATSRAASIRRCAPHTSRRRRWWSRTRSRGTSTSTSPPSPLGTGHDGNTGVSQRYLAERGRGHRDGARGDRQRPVHTRVRSGSSTATSTGSSCRRRPARSSTGTRTRPTSASHRISSAWHPSPRRLQTSSTRACSPLLGELDHHRPHLTGRKHLRREPGRRSTCASTASRRVTSTPTVRGAATTT